MSEDIAPILQKSPQVAIVGRPNVGKSSLFNRLAGRKIAIVMDQPGITRDRIHGTCEQTMIPCDLVDTGGIGEEADEEFTSDVQVEAEIAMSSADVILFVVDRRQTSDAVRRNYPVLGRFRHLFTELGEFFRQYFFAMDREELPFNRAQRDWIGNAASKRSNTIAFASLFLYKFSFFPTSKARNIRRAGIPAAKHVISYLFYM